MLLGGFVFTSVNRCENWALLAAELLFPTRYMAISVPPMGKGENKFS